MSADARFKASEKRPEGIPSLVYGKTSMHADERLQLAGVYLKHLKLDLGPFMDRNAAERKNGIGDNSCRTVILDN